MLDPRITGSEDEARQITLALFSVVFYGSIIENYGFNTVFYCFVWFDYSFLWFCMVWWQGSLPWGCLGAKASGDD